jgi:hypothetical protein
MNLNVRRLAAGLMVVAAGSVFAPACADNESSLFIRAVQAQDEMCVFPAPGTDAVVLLAGALDVRVASTYSAGLILGNQIVRRGDEDKIRTETSRIHLYAADVSILDSGQSVIQRADGADASFEVPVTGFVDPGSSSEPGYGTAVALLIDSDTSAQLKSQIGPRGRTDIIVSIIVRGRTLGGSEIESGEFQFPITVCDGCLLSSKSEADDPASPEPDCDAATDITCPCSSGQDQGIDCCCLGVAACGLP